MKTIRRGIFETNSSSTHTISIVPINSGEPVVVNNIIYPDRLSSHSKSDGDNELFIANTKELKIALFLKYVQEVPRYEFFEKLIQDKYHYEDIVFEPQRHFYVFDESGDIFVEDILNAIEDESIEIIYTIVQN